MQAIRAMRAASSGRVGKWSMPLPMASCSVRSISLARVSALPVSAASQKARSALEDTAHYFDENRARMLYGTYRNQGLSIGSGPIESAVKNVVNLRMKGCGMRWAKDRAEHMLHLRAAHLSNIGPPNGLLQAA